MSLFQELRALEERGIDLVEILGQDAPLESPAALQEIVDRLHLDGASLYAELLHFLTYRRFSAEEAEQLWHEIMARKRDLESRLERRVGFRVAALDLLGGERELLRGVRLVARPEFQTLFGFVHVDEVTGVFNRRYFNDTVRSEVQRAKRYGSHVSLLVLDVDDFKRVNDSVGHLQGDAALRRVGRLIRDTTRQTDTVCRFGGDEFAVILPETRAAEAATTAERIRRAVAELQIGVEADRPPICCTSSIGGAAYPTSADDAEELVALADQMCLDAKRGGKNRVRVVGHDQDVGVSLEI